MNGAGWTRLYIDETDSLLLSSCKHYIFKYNFLKICFYINDLLIRNTVTRSWWLMESAKYYFSVAFFRTFNQVVTI